MCVCGRGTHLTTRRETGSRGPAVSRPVRSGESELRDGAQQNTFGKATLSISHAACWLQVQSGYFASQLQIPSLRTERLCPAKHLESYASWTHTLQLEEHHSGGVVLKPISETFSRGLIVVDWETSGRQQCDGAESSLVTTWLVSGGSQDCCDHRAGSDIFVIPPGTARTFVVPHGVGSGDEADLMMLLQELIHVDGLSESYLFQERAQVREALRLSMHSRLSN